MSDSINVEYLQNFYNTEYADRLFDEVYRLPFRSQTLTVMGKKFTPRRKIVAYGDNGVIYNFSGISVPAQPWIPSILKVKEDVERKLSVKFNYVMLNLYEDGKAKIGAHRDAEKELSKTSPIVTLSLGVTRKMLFQRRSQPTVEFNLQHGSLLVMNPPTNELFTHAIPEQPEVTEPRISLTFRHIIASPSKRPGGDGDDDDDDGPETCAKREKLDNLGLCLERDNAEYKVFPSHTYDLSEEVRCCVGVFNMTPRIDIRRYKRVNNRRIPTKEGIVISPCTWFYFCDKIYNFNLVYKDTSFIVNNCLLAINSNGLHLQNVECIPNTSLRVKETFITLSEDEITKLLEIEHDMTNYLIELLWLHILPHNICLMYTSSASLSSDDDDDDNNDALLINYIICIENNFNILMKNIFKCHGCINNSLSQVNHECQTLPLKEKFANLGPRAWVLLPIDSIVSELSQQSIRINYNTVKDFTMDHYKNMLFL